MVNVARGVGISAMEHRALASVLWYACWVAAIFVALHFVVPREWLAPHGEFHRALQQGLCFVMTSLLIANALVRFPKIDLKIALYDTVFVTVLMVGYAGLLEIAQGPVGRHATLDDFVRNAEVILMVGSLSVFVLGCMLIRRKAALRGDSGLRVERFGM